MQLKSEPPWTGGETPIQMMAITLMHQLFQWWFTHYLTYMYNIIIEIHFNRWTYPEGSMAFTLFRKQDYNFSHFSVLPFVSILSDARPRAAYTVDILYQMYHRE